jgi:hypothetical protein
VTAASLRRSPRTALHALVMTLTIWLVFVYGSYVISELINGRRAFIGDLKFDIPAVIIVALLAQLLYPLAERTAGRPPVQRWLALFMGAMLIAAVQALVGILVNTLLGHLNAFDPAQFEAVRRRYAASLLSHLYLSFANGALFVFLVEARRNNEQRIRLAEAEGMAASARASALRAQLNPHFMFNALNSLSSLMLTRRNEDAEAMLQKLCEFMRLSLDFRPDEQVSLEDEFAALECYLEIEAVRFGSRMVVDLDLPGELARVKVPGLILQPLVENAVKYGVARSAGEVIVKVSAARRGDTLVLTVSDTGSTAAGLPDSKGFGIGLGNVRERLSDHFGEAASLETRQDSGGFTATICLPCAG